MIGMSVPCSVLTTVTNHTVLNVREDYINNNNENKIDNNMNNNKNDKIDNSNTVNNDNNKTHNNNKNDNDNNNDNNVDKNIVKRNFVDGLEKILKNPKTRVFELRGLNKEEVKDLLILYIGEENVSLELIELVCNVSSGNAFWCKIVANFIIENGIEKAKDENYLSNSLQFLMFCRLDKFSSVEQLVAKTASIIGFQFSLSVLSKIVKSPLLIPCLEALQDHGFIFCNGFDGIDYNFQFQNEKIRIMLYEITPKRY
jgi:predicted ATPase